MLSSRFRSLVCVNENLTVGNIFHFIFIRLKSNSSYLDCVYSQYDIEEVIFKRFDQSFS